MIVRAGISSAIGLLVKLLLGGTPLHIMQVILILLQLHLGFLSDTLIISVIFATVDMDTPPLNDESGNAHAESMRIKERNKRMARFIHHFSR